MNPRILFIDAYDSFTNNIVSLLETSLDVEVIVVKIDFVVSDLPTLLKSFSAVVAGPGPGTPKNGVDVGLIEELWKLNDPELLPILGICLGFQSLVLAFGGTVQPLALPRHGIERHISSKRASPDENSIFGDIDRFVSVQYHSLHASLGHQTEAGSSEYDDYWKATSSCPDLEPLAWDIAEDNRYNDLSNSDSNNPSRILMAVKHKYKPFFGVQFHPESICSDANARNSIVQWWSTVSKWHWIHDRAYRTPCVFDSLEPMNDKSNPESVGAIVQPSSQAFIDATTLILERPTTYASISSSSTTSFTSAMLSSPASNCSSPASVSTTAEGGNHNLFVDCKSSILGDLTVPVVCELLSLAMDQVIILDSEVRQMPKLATHSIIGFITPQTPRLEYTIGCRHVRLIQNGSTSFEDLQCCGGNIFSYLKWFMQSRKVADSHASVPFWGGLMGYINYEACLETIDEDLVGKRRKRPDVSFAFVERSIVIDHARQLFYVQSIMPQDSTWLDITYNILLEGRDSQLLGLGAESPRLNHKESNGQIDTTLEDYLSSGVDIQMPAESSYKNKIRACQKHIRAGDSYELCLTDQASVRVKSNLSPTAWPLYVRLRQLNPAPFGAYVSLGPLTLLSTSPERFLTWSRPSYHDELCSTSICQFRPIKGTVSKYQKTADGKVCTLDLAEATSLLLTTKERAENLMIVDLIRHDLHGVAGSGNVTVEKLMAVEEYASVFQLVSVIEGTLKISSVRPSTMAPSDDPMKIGNKVLNESKSGIDVLAASLPPGSMTGAPKRRSCELLHSIEDCRPRSIYSGIVGYMCVGGRGDFSVVIRSMYKWDEESQEDDGREEEKRHDVWQIGAGGAITALSDEQGEWEEMKVKLMSTMRVFKES